MKTPESLSAWVKNSAARERYLEAFRRSDFQAMLHYYKQNYPRQPYQEVSLPVKVQAPVFQIHGKPYLLPGGLNNTWEWLEKDWTLSTIRQAGHFVQHDAAGLVTRNILNWKRNYRPVTRAKLEREHNPLYMRLEKEGVIYR